MEKKPLYRKLAQYIEARENCIKNKNDDWTDKWDEKIDKIINNLPHGSGIDGKTEIDLEKSNSNRIVINSEFHHMNDGGFYDGWTNFTIVIKPSLAHLFELQIKGKFGKYQDTRGYLEELFGTTFASMVDAY